MPSGKIPSGKFTTITEEPDDDSRSSSNVPEGENPKPKPDSAAADQKIEVSEPSRGKSDSNLSRKSKRRGPTWGEVRDLSF